MAQVAQKLSPCRYLSKRFRLLFLQSPEKVVVLEMTIIFRCSQQSRICDHLSYLQPREFLLHVYIIVTTQKKTLCRCLNSSPEYFIATIANSSSRVFPDLQCSCLFYEVKLAPSRAPQSRVKSVNAETSDHAKREVPCGLSYARITRRIFSV